MKIKILLFFVLFASVAQAQINMDSLKQYLEMSNRWKNTKSVDYLMQPFQRFEIEDKTETYDLFIDSLGNLNELFGVTAVYRKFDQQKRLTKLIGYKLNGNYFYWDYSPIILNEYRQDTTIVDYYDTNFMLTERNITIHDAKERIVEKLVYDSSLKLSSRRVNDYFDRQNMLFLKSYDGNGKLKLDKKGLAVKLQIFDDKNRIIEERFYDSQMNLIEADHGFEEISACEFSILKRVFSKKEEHVYYYNSKNELVCESDMFRIIVINTEKYID